MKKQKKTMQKNKAWRGIPLKKMGFQKQKGTRPHFRKMQNRKLNQVKDEKKIDFKSLEAMT